MARTDDLIAHQVRRWERYDPELAGLKTGPSAPSLEAHTVSLALSGGGHRAALFGLGCMMAMCDLGAVPPQVSSVSGGSITNLALAHHYFAPRSEWLRNGATSAAPAAAPSWDEATLTVFKNVSSGVLTGVVLLPLIALMVAPPVLLIGLAMAGALSSPRVAGIVTIWIFLLACRGLIVESLMAHRYFGSWRGPKLTDLASPIQHVVCATDLVTGKPVHLGANGSSPVRPGCRCAFRRTADLVDFRIPHYWEKPDPVTVGVFANPVARHRFASVALRASAAFPGIPPRRVVWADRASSPLASTSYLSDGGVWNNLATEPFLDGTLWGYRAQDPLERAVAVLVADASAEPRPVRSLQFAVPIWNDLAGLLRQASIQNSSTVEPRRHNFRQELLHDVQIPGTAYAYDTRLYLVTRSAETPEMIVEAARDYSIEAAANIAPVGVFEVWLARRKRMAERIAQFGSTRVWQQLAAMGTIDGAQGGKDEVARYKTTLGRVDHKIAIALVARGYANTVTTLYSYGLVDHACLPTGWLRTEIEKISPTFNGPQD